MQRPIVYVNDMNDWSPELEGPRHTIDVLARIVAVSLETMKIVDALPSLDIKDRRHGERQ